MVRFFLISLFCISILANNSVIAQGCSDAGVCTINNIKDHSLDFTGKKLNNAFKSGITYGLGEIDVKVINPYLEYTGIINQKISLSGKITYAFVYGELANTSNLGDLFLSSTYSFREKENSNLNMLIGAKIPFNSSNIKENSNALPMHYQTSLGTYDLILGANYSYENLGISIAWQQPFINSNKNEFISPIDQNLPEFKYQSTNSYNRKGDVILRASYKIPLFERSFSIRPGLLGIYHLSDDTYLDQSNNEQSISGSKGLTLNGNLFLNYRFSEKIQLELSVGFPFITRDSRPDGLTRKLVAGLEYTYLF